MADKVWNDGFKNIILLGIGGTEFELGPIGIPLKKYSDIDIELVNAADANTIHPKKLTKDTLVITASASGDILETTDGWFELNATAAQRQLNPIANGQQIIIVIGEGLNKEKIEMYLQA